MAKEKKHALDIKDVLKAIDLRDFEYYSRLTDEERKSLNMWMTMRWISSSAKYSEMYICMVNELVNKDFTVIYKHPELQWRLLCMCGLGTSVYHPWIKPPGSKRRNNPVHDWVKTVYPEMKDDDVIVFLSVNEPEALQQLAKDNGMTDGEIKEIWG